MRKIAVEPGDIQEGVKTIKEVVDTAKGFFNKREPAAEPNNATVLQQDTTLNELMNLLKSFGVEYQNINALISELKPLMASSTESLVQVVEAMKDFLYISRMMFPSAQSDYANNFVKFVLKYFTSVSDIKKTVDAITNLTNKLKEGQDLYVLGAIGEGEESKSMMVLSILMNSFGKYDPKSFEELSQVAALSNQMYGERDPDLLNSQMLRDEVAKTNFSALMKSRSKFRVLVPVYITVNQASQLIYDGAANLYGSDFAKAAANDPMIKTWFTLKHNIGRGLKVLNDPSNADLISGGVK